MQSYTQQEQHMQHTFASLPPELFQNVLDQLLGNSNSRKAVAFAPSNDVTKALRALTLVSRQAYILASRYLYSHCLYLDDCIKYTRFRRTMGLDLGLHPESLRYGQAGRNDQLFYEADVSRHISSLFISPMKTQKCGDAPMVRLPQIIDLGLSVGRTLRRLLLDLQPVYASGSEIQQVKPYISTNNIFLHMPALEELICSFDASDYFPQPPPNLKRLAMTFRDLEQSYLDFCFAISTLEMLVFLRPEDLSAAHVDELFRRYKGRHLDVVLVDTYANHLTPRNTRDWKETDHVTIWEADVPTAFYADDEDLVLCDSWIWTHGVKGTLWAQQKRQMLCWSRIQSIV